MNSIPLKYFLDDEEVDLKTSNPLIKSFIQAIEDPSVDYDQELLLESVFSGMAISGEGYVFPTENAAGRVGGLKYLRPDKVSKTQSSDCRVHQYEYNSGDDRMIFNRTSSVIDGERVENVPSLVGRFNLVLYRTYNPTSDVNGLSRLAAAGLSIDGHNGALEWNNSILKNAGKPSGMLSALDKDGAGMSPEQIQQLMQKLNIQSTGKNRGKIAVFNSPMKFEKFSMNSQEMDFISGIVQRATDICNALDYPPFLLGFVGSTFNNQAEAKLSLYENSAIPKAQHFYGNLAKFLSRKYDVNFKIKTDISAVDAMAPRFAEKNDSIIKQWEKNVIDQNEARKMLGHEKVTGGDGLYFGDFGGNQNINNIES
jgi:HK97 family phage portal protein